MPPKTQVPVILINKGTNMYKRIGRFTPEEVLMHVSITPEDPKPKHKEFVGQMVYMRSSRYENFKAHGLMCVECGLVGTHFHLERHESDKSTEKFHFNLYGTNEKGKEVMLTKDHITPRAKGGTDTLENYQVMCTTCNSKKGHNWVSTEQLIHKARLEGARKAKATADAQVLEIMQTCPHDILKSDTTDGAYCSICDTRFGWYCKDSPDKVCHYFTDHVDGKFYAIDMVRMENYLMPRYTLDKHNNECKDECIFCGNPEERS